MSLKLAVGDPLPSVGLRATDGYLLNLRSFVTKQPAVILFFGAPTAERCRASSRAEGHRGAGEGLRTPPRGRHRGGRRQLPTRRSSRRSSSRSIELPFLLLSDERRSAVEVLGIQTVADGENVNVVQPVALAVDRDGIVRAIIERVDPDALVDVVIQALSEPIPAAAEDASTTVLTSSPMRAVRLHAVGGPLRVEEVPMPDPAGTEVRVRVAGCGVCHTDLHVVDGIQTRVELPVTLGHEVAGWIDAIGPMRPTRVRRGSATRSSCTAAGAAASVASAVRARSSAARDRWRPASRRTAATPMR